MLLIARFLKTAFNINTNIEHLENLKNYVFSKGVSFFLTTTTPQGKRKLATFHPTFPETLTVRALVSILQILCMRVNKMGSPNIFSYNIFSHKKL